MLVIASLQPSDSSPFSITSRYRPKITIAGNAEIGGTFILTPHQSDTFGPLGHFEPSWTIDYPTMTEES
jgi:hypothetical protein